MDLGGNLTFVATFHSCLSDSLKCISLWLVINSDVDFFCCVSAIRFKHILLQMETHFPSCTTSYS